MFLRGGGTLRKPAMKKGKGKPQQVAEYAGFCAAVAAARIMPFAVLRAVARFLGMFLHVAIPKRRRIALQNLRIAFGKELTEREIGLLARRSCEAFFLTAIEAIRSPYRFEEGRAHRDRRHKTGHLEALFQKAKRIHDEEHGCIFVTPHLGNWELLPCAAALMGIPLAIVIRPLDNPYLERAILSNRIAAGNVVIPKMNAMFALERMLRQGKSIGLLPDQSTSRGLRVDFFGREATVTPIPALLALKYDRPVVVVAACRTADPDYFEGFVSDPIRPGREAPDEQAEIVRITREINARIEEIIRKHPEQYLWMHNRWKKSDKKAIFADK